MKKIFSNHFWLTTSKNAAQKYCRSTLHTTRKLYLTILKSNNYQKIILVDNSLKFLIFYNVPRNCCSRSIDSKRALKLPAPKPLAPIR